MRWITPEPTSGPSMGDTRERVIFAIRPRRCDDGFTRWLVPLRVTERYTWWPDWDNGHFYWKEVSARCSQ